MQLSSFSVKFKVTMQTTSFPICIISFFWGTAGQNVLFKTSLIFWTSWHIHLLLSIWVYVCWKWVCILPLDLNFDLWFYINSSRWQFLTSFCYRTFRIFFSVLKESRVVACEEESICSGRLKGFLIPGPQLMTGSCASYLMALKCFHGGSDSLLHTHNVKLP